MVLWGFITRYLNTLGFNFVPVLLGAVLFWDFFGRVMQGVTMTFFEDVWSRKLPQPLRHAAVRLGIRRRSGALGRRDELGRARRDGGRDHCRFRPSPSSSMGSCSPRSFSSSSSPGSPSASPPAGGAPLGPASEWFVWPIPAFLSLRRGFYPVSTLPPGCGPSPTCYLLLTYSRRCARSSRARPTGEPRCC